MQTLIDDYNVSKFVLNMSWMVLPCNLKMPDDMVDYIRAICGIEAGVDLGEETLNKTTSFLNFISSDTLEPEVFCQKNSAGEPDLILTTQNISQSYLQLWLTSSNGTNYDWLVQSRNSASLGEFLNCFASEEYPYNQDGTCKLNSDSPIHVISIAAAGNQSNAKFGTDNFIEFPVWPALLSSVVAVSASDGNGDLTSISNYGEIMMDGTYPGFPSDKAWTSYSTPRLSTYAAIYLANERPVRCADRPNIFPPLGYNDEDRTTWDNLPLDTNTTNEYCVEFPIP
jgi:hypothetical protein